MEGEKRGEKEEKIKWKGGLKEEERVYIKGKRRHWNRNKGKGD